MPYVRRRRHQLALVHGERHPKTRQVEQRELFVLYSRSEVRDALGRREQGVDPSFRVLLEDRYPRIRFDWKKIRRQLEAEMDALPEEYGRRGEDRRADFRKDLGAFVRRLLVTAPQESPEAAEVIREHWMELEYVARLIREHVKLSQSGKLAHWEGDRVPWHFALIGNGIPPEAEEEAAGFFERGELDRAEAIFRLLVECFENYAEGYNYLGLIALRRGRIKEAVTQFERTVVLGRRLFPQRIARTRYWTDLSTRPFLRGMRNLAYALTVAGRFEEALAACDQLELEVGDEATTTSHRASIHLNQGRWEEVEKLADSLPEIDASESFVLAFALAEMKKLKEALPAFIHGALNHPDAVPVLAGRVPKQPRSIDEQEDLDLAEALRRKLGVYYQRRESPATRKFFETALNHPGIRALLSEVREVRRRWREEGADRNPAAFRRMQEMRTIEFARARAAELDCLTEGSGK